MYLNHFGLQRHPFSLTPDTDLFFNGGGREQILEMLLHAIQSGEGIIKVVGEVGSGKTMLCRILCHRLPKTVDVAILLNPNIPPEQIVATVLRELRVTPNPSGNRWADQHILLNHLVDLHRSGRHALVLVEEAQSMSMASLEELRLLSNFETSRTKLFQIVLFGQPELDQTLAAHENRHLRERITTSLHLPPLTLKETGLYLQHRLEATGHPDGKIFTNGAVRGLYQTSKGGIRRINVLAHKALVAAFTDSSRLVRSRHIRTAMASSEFSTDFFASMSLWMRPILVACGLATLIISGTVLHSWGNTSRSGTIPRMGTDIPLEERLKMNANSM
ncbi:MAG: AAA family ATPase, partial [Magnetococcales bacterium]|nr:AAA family ATPase [Magnetococcales bacterium]